VVWASHYNLRSNQQEVATKMSRDMLYHFPLNAQCSPIEPQRSRSTSRGSKALALLKTIMRHPYGETTLRNVVPNLIEKSIVRALNELGSWEWADDYEVVQLSHVCWSVQSCHSTIPPIGRYEVTVKFVAHEPSYFEVTHSGGNFGVLTTRTSNVSYDELLGILRQIYEKFGPMLPIIPIH
jgi:hypothetical protein